MNFNFLLLKKVLKKKKRRECTKMFSKYKNRFWLLVRNNICIVFMYRLCYTNDMNEAFISHFINGIRIPPTYLTRSTNNHRLNIIEMRVFIMY